MSDSDREQTPIEAAEAAVCERIAKHCEGGNPSDDSHEKTAKLAHAVAELKHGPQGGTYRYDGDYRTENTNRSESTSHSDDHRTDHQGEERPRPAPGFNS